MAENRVTTLYDEGLAIFEFLLAQGEYSFAATVDSTSRKVLLMAVASFFEVHLTDAVKGYVTLRMGDGHPVAEVIRRKVVDRQYHTWFSWEARNVNSFLSIFGDGFKQFMLKKFDSDNALQVAVVAFLDIGSSRNALTHQNFGAFTLEKTTREIFEAYERALPFVESFEDCLREYTLLFESGSIGK